MYENVSLLYTLETKVIPDNPVQAYNCKWCNQSNLRGVVFLVASYQSTPGVFWAFCSEECRHNFIDSPVFAKNLFNAKPEEIDPLNIFSKSSGAIEND